MRLGVMQAILGMRTEEVLDVVRDIGCDGVQLVLGSDYSDNPLWTEAGAERIARQAERAGVEICSVCTGVLNQIGLASREDRTRWRAADIVTHAIDACAAMGVGRILVPFFGKMSIEDDAGAARAAGELSKLAPKAADARVVLAVECTLSAPDTLEIIKRVGSDSVRVYYDMGNAYRFGFDPCAEVRQLAGQIEEVHIKDATRGGVVPLGEGEVDLKAVIVALREVGYDDYLVLETRLGEDRLADARSDVDRVDRVFEELRRKKR